MGLKSQRREAFAGLGSARVPLVRVESLVSERP
jgi:hypothetical protein